MKHFAIALALIQVQAVEYTVDYKASELQDKITAAFTSFAGDGPILSEKVT
jgi:hypothetical protein